MTFFNLFAVFLFLSRKQSIDADMVIVNSPPYFCLLLCSNFLDVAPDFIFGFLKEINAFNKL